MDDAFESQSEVARQAAATCREYERLVRVLGHIPRYTPRTVAFLEYRFDVPDVPSFLDQFKEIFFDSVYTCSLDRAAPVIFDVGANIGMSSLYFRTKYPKARILAFEADPKLVEILKGNLDEAKMMDGNLEVLAKAAWVEDGLMEFTSEGADGGSLHTYGSWPVIKVESVRLKAFIEREASIDFLKMDIEGAEIDIIKDCADVLHKVRFFFFEYHSWLDRRQELDALLRIIENAGFRYYLETVCKRYRPFINLVPEEELVNADPLKENMDLQLNVFAYRTLA